MKKIALALTLLLIFSGCNPGNEPETEIQPEEEIGGGTETETNPIVITSPQPNEVVSDPFTITGEAIGPWFFEAAFSVYLEDNTGNQLAQTIASTSDDWMTEDYVSFEATFEDFDTNGATDGFLIFEKANPSGLPENAEEFAVPIQFEITFETMEVRVYFPNSIYDPNIEDCTKVHGVNRTVETETMEASALEALLKGPSKDEVQAGYVTAINEDTILERFDITDGIATASMSEEFTFEVGGSCLVTLIRTQIGETLLQFDTIDSVELLVNEEPAILEP